VFACVLMYGKLMLKCCGQSASEMSAVSYGIEFTDVVAAPVVSLYN
jgi:hypothetical protein